MNDGLPQPSAIGTTRTVLWQEVKTSSPNTKLKVLLDTNSNVRFGGPLGLVWNVVSWYENMYVVS